MTLEVALTPQPLSPHQPSVAVVVVPEVKPLEQRAIEHQRPAPTPGEPPRIIAPPPLEVPSTPPAPAHVLPPRKPGPYTGLLIDATGFGLVRSMCPKIFRRDGTEVWGTMDVEPEVVQRTGIAGFVDTLDEALSLGLSPRLGANPLVVRAIGRQGTVWANAVVSDEDSTLILAEDRKTHFLEKLRVTFVVGD